jgi:hypothetical protein
MTLKPSLGSYTTVEKRLNMGWCPTSATLGGATLSTLLLRPVLIYMYEN